MKSILAVLLCSVISISAVTFGWTLSPDFRVIYQRLYYGGQSGSYSNYVELDAFSNRATLTNLIVGQVYYATIVVYDNQGDNAPSNELKFTNQTGITLEMPLPPVNPRKVSEKIGP